MKIEPLTAGSPGPAGLTRRVWNLRQWPALIASVFAVWLIWRVNHAKLDILYDYSLVASGVGFLHLGMKPYRDFVTPLQPLNFYLSYVSEVMFGRTFLSLTYGNLILTYILFIALLKYAANFLSLAGACLFALAICSASTLQHGIPWHNCVGLLCLVLVCMASFHAVRAGTFSSRDTLAISIFLFLTGLTKLNYLMAALVVVGFSLLSVYLTKEPRWRTLLIKTDIFAFSGIVAPILLELLVTGTNIQNWIWNVVSNPGRRSGRLMLILSKEFFLGTVQPYYYRNPFRAVFGLSMLLFLYLGLKFSGRGTSQAAPEVRRTVLAARAALVLFFGLAAMLSVTNVDMASISQALLPVGLLSVAVGYGDRLSEFSRTALRRAILVFAAAFLAAGVTATYLHTRLKYPYVKTAGFSPHKVEGLEYLDGVSMGDRAYARVQESATLLAHFGMGAGSNEVYWGPGLDMLWRVFHTTPHPGFPLWYHIGVTVRDAAADDINRQFDASPIRLIIADKIWAYNFPDAVTTHLNARWKRGETGSLVYFHRN